MAYIRRHVDPKTGLIVATSGIAVSLVAMSLALAVASFPLMVGACGISAFSAVLKLATQQKHS
jgi:hypothetical protein